MKFDKYSPGRDARTTTVKTVPLCSTWHDDASSLQLIACAPPGFKYVEIIIVFIQFCYFLLNRPAF